MTNPFEDDAAEHVVLMNDRVQYSLWPAALRVPPGWLVVHGPASRQGSLDFVEEHWHELRPSPLRDTPDRIDGAEQCTT